MRKSWPPIKGDPVLVEQGRHLVATFHPELTDDTRVTLRSNCSFLENLTTLELEPSGFHPRSFPVHRKFLPQPDGRGFCEEPMARMSNGHERGFGACPGRYHR